MDLQEAFLLDVVAGRSGKVVDDWLGGRPEEWLQAISVVALDPFRGDANGLLAHLGHAAVVVDHFHTVRLANKAIDDVRRRVQNQTTGHRGRRGDPLYGIRRLALVGAERLSERGWGRLLAGLAAGDPEGEMGAAILAKELLREVYGADGTAQAAQRLEVFHRHCSQAEVPELTRLAKTIKAWRDEVLAYHTTGLSNGPTEAVIIISYPLGRHRRHPRGRGVARLACRGHIPWSA